jgi:hypothetical protein
MTTTYRTADVDGCDVFYREAGSRSNPTLLLLNGFPTSSHQYRDLIPLLVDHFHLVGEWKDPGVSGCQRETYWWAEAAVHPWSRSAWRNVASGDSAPLVQQQTAVEAFPSLQSCRR